MAESKTKQKKKKPIRVYKDLVRKTTFGKKETEKEKTKVVSLSLSKS